MLYRPHLSQISFFSLLAVATILFSSCVHDLVDEGVYSSTIVRGTVLEQRSHQPVAALHVRLMHDGHTLHAAVTSFDGTFQLPLQFDELHRGVRLEVYADSLYDGTSVDLLPQGYGHQYYDVGILYVQGPELPTVLTGEVSDVLATTARAVGNVIASGKSSVVSRGLCWSKLQYPTLNNAYVVCGSGEGPFASLMENLEVGTTYYVRAFAINGVGTAYGEQHLFTTLDGLPSVQTASITLMGSAAAQCGGVVTTDGGFSVTARGVCWSLSPEPSVSNLHTTDGSGLGSFVSTLSGLYPSSTYYVRAYATNVNGTVYGEQRVLTTPNGLPSVLTTAATAITATRAVCGGNVTTDGGYTVIQRGVCYSTTPGPTVSSPHTTDGSGTGIFVSNLTSLTPNTIYHYRAYATNATGTVYGEERSFMTTN